MNLVEAVKNFESKFEEVVKTKNTDEVGTEPRICSGGIITGAEVLPALYASADLAIDAWLETATFHIGYACAKLEWILRPELMEFQITMADRKNQHRLVANRFAVKSQFKAYRQ